MSRDFAEQVRERILDRLAGRPKTAKQLADLFCAWPARLWVYWELDALEREGAIERLRIKGREYFTVTTLRSDTTRTTAGVVQ